MAKHPNKHIREAIHYAEQSGWTFERPTRVPIFSGHYTAPSGRARGIAKPYFRRRAPRNGTRSGFGTPWIGVNTNELEIMDMAVFGFRVILHGIEVMTEEIAESLYHSGCDDCSPFSGEGLAGADFDREAETLEGAVTSALNDVRKAGYEVVRVEIEAQDLKQLEMVAS